MFALILVGGLGTRLRPFTNDIPKALLPVLNKPFISYQLDFLSKSSITDVVFAAGKSGRGWESSLQKISRGRFRFHFVYEKELLGTGGAIRHAYDSYVKKTKKRDRAIVLNGDVFFNFDINKFSRFHQLRKSLATIALSHVSDPTGFGLVPVDPYGKVKEFLEKPDFKLKENFINAGVYMIEPEFIDLIPSGQVISIERNIFPSILKKKLPLYGYKITGYWNDIGTNIRYREAHGDLLKQVQNWTGIKFLRKRGGSRVIVGRNSQIHPSVIFEGFASIGQRVIIEKGCVIRDSVVHDGVHIKEGAVIHSSILGQQGNVGAYSTISENSFLGPDFKLSPYSKI